MRSTTKVLSAVAVLLALAAPLSAQETPPTSDEPAATGQTTDPEEGATAPADDTAAPADEPAGPTDDTTPPADPTVVDESNTPTDAARETLDDVAEEVDRRPEAQQASAGILRPIYALAERFSFPAFHWVAFSLMVAGVVSFAMQLVLGKLVVLSRMSLSISEILSDALGLAVSLIGLVLTTQAATENSTFTTSAFSVLSATGVGALAGFIFYLWGQRQELQAVEGRRAAAVRERNVPPTKR